MWGIVNPNCLNVVESRSSVVFIQTMAEEQGNELNQSLGAIAAILAKLQQRADEAVSMPTNFGGPSASRPTTSTTSAPLALPNFDPDTVDSAMWLQKIEMYKNEFGWFDRETVSRAAPFLLKSAQRWFSAWQPTDDSWEIFKSDLSISFPRQKNLGKLLEEAVTFRSTGTGSYAEYARVKFEKLKNLRAGWSDSDLIEIIAYSIDDSAVRTAAFNCGATTVGDLIAFLANYVKNSDRTLQVPIQRRGLVSQANPSLLRQIDCFNCGKSGHFARDCRSVNREHVHNSHRTSDKYVTVERMVIPWKFASNVRISELLLEHLSPGRLPDKKSKTENVLFNFESFRSNLKTMPITISGHSTGCLIDTGSTCSLISESFANKLGFEKIPQVTPLQWFDGTIYNSTSYINTHLELPDVKLSLKLILVPYYHCDYDVILGEDLYENDVTLVRNKHVHKILPKIAVINTISIQSDLEIITGLNPTDKQRLLH